MHSPLNLTSDGVFFFTRTSDGGGEGQGAQFALPILIFLCESIRKFVGVSKGMI